MKIADTELLIGVLANSLSLYADSIRNWYATALSDMPAEKRDFFINHITLVGSTADVAGALIAQAKNSLHRMPVPGRTLMSFLLRAMMKQVTDYKLLEELASLFRRYDLETSTLETPLALQEWQGEEIEVNPGMLQPVWFLEEAMSAARAVVYLNAPNQEGTGFVVGDNLILTCDHVRKNRLNRDLLAGMTATFNYQLNKDGTPEESITLKADPQGPQWSSPRRDYTLFSLDLSSLADGRLPLDIMPLKLNSKGDTSIDDTVSIIQHPGGKPKMICMRGNFVKYVDQDILQYVTSTLPGSSGAPVLSERMEVVALHRRGSQTLTQQDTKQTYARNEGVQMRCILDDIKSDAPALLPHLNVV